jgi:hypothetical protein
VAYHARRHLRHHTRPDDAKHKANHIQVVYATDPPSADSAMRAKAAMADALGINVNICGSDKQAKPWP